MLAHPCTPLSNSNLTRSRNVSSPLTEYGLEQRISPFNQRASPASFDSRPSLSAFESPSINQRLPDTDLAIATSESRASLVFISSDGFERVANNEQSRKVSKNSKELEKFEEELSISLI